MFCSSILPLSYNRMFPSNFNKFQSIRIPKYEADAFLEFYLKPPDGISRILRQFWQTSILRLQLVDFQGDQCLQRFIVARLIFAWIFFRGCKYWYISRGFISVDGEVLIISSGIIFVATKHISMVFIVYVGKRESITATLR